MSLNLSMIRLFSLDKSFFVTDKSECSGCICENIPHLATFTLMLSDATHLLFVLSIRGHPYELKAYHE